MRHHDIPHGLEPTLVEKATRVARLPGDHSQVGWLPPSCTLYDEFRLFAGATPHVPEAGNQSPIPFDTLRTSYLHTAYGWESITNPL